MNRPAVAIAKRCLVWGGYGQGNTGDDLTLAVALRELQAERGNVLSVLSPVPVRTRLVARGVEIVPFHRINERPLPLGAWALDRGWVRLGAALYRLRLALRRRRIAGTNWVAAVLRADFLHLVGGGYLTDQFNLELFLPPLRLAAARGIPVTTSPLGIGPFQSERAARRVMRALRTARVVVRDESSAKVCRAHGLAVEMRRDDGFRLDEVVGKPEEDAARPPGSGRVGVCIFPQHGGDWSARVEQWWCELLCVLARRLGPDAIEGFCFHTDRAKEFGTMQRLFGAAGLDPALVRPPDADFRDAVRRVARYDAIISTRFHAVVVAGAWGIPALAVAAGDYYRTKMRAALEGMTDGAGRLVDPAARHSGAVAEQLLRLAGAGHELRH